MTTTVLILLGGAFLAGVLTGLLALLAAGIRTDDRRRNIHLAPENHAQSASRRLLVNIRHADSRVQNDEDA